MKRSKMALGASRNAGCGIALEEGISRKRGLNPLADVDFKCDQASCEANCETIDDMAYTSRSRARGVDNQDDAHGRATSHKRRISYSISRALHRHAYNFGNWIFSFVRCSLDVFFAIGGYIVHDKNCNYFVQMDGQDDRNCRLIYAEASRQNIIFCLCGVSYGTFLGGLS